MKVNSYQIKPSLFSLAEIVMVFSLIGLISAISIPDFVMDQTSEQSDVCIAKLRQKHGSVDPNYVCASKQAESTSYCASRSLLDCFACQENGIVSTISNLVVPLDQKTPTEISLIENLSLVLIL